MSNKRSNYPEGQATAALDGNTFTGTAVNCIMDLGNRGKPIDENDLSIRINDYFSFCGSHNFRPGVESMSLSLGVSRISFWKWCQRNDAWGEICRQAKQRVIAFTEAAALSGHLSPPIAIFALKNIANWKDTLSFEEMLPDEQTQRVSPEMIARRHGVNASGAAGAALPVATFIES